jgi:hypothetical protein
MTNDDELSVLHGLLGGNGGKGIYRLIPVSSDPNHLESCHEGFTVINGYLGYRGKRDINHGFRRLFTNPFSVT